ncbi:hypothetical protein EGM51_08905 [Verrucomicrobia bacterium S94]|nr:hypothetical protein EGM51_08905 [Verrucomicrobia bacterium S94]
MGGSVLIAVLALDSVMLSSHYFKADNIARIKKGNDIVRFIKENQGNERTFFMDQSGIYNQWLASDGPFHGLNLFNIWQMPRMPSEYKEFLGTVGRNQIRVWELSAVKYVAAPQTVLQQFKNNPALGEQFTPVLNYQIPTAKGMRPEVLLEFKNAVPRFALYSNWQVVPLENQCSLLVSESHNPQTTVLVDSGAGLPEAKLNGSRFQALKAEVSKKAAVVELETDKPSILRFAQRFQPGWRVEVDGKPAELLRVDYLCMGVAVPEGKHTVEFRCVSGASEMVFSSGVFILSFVGGVVCIVIRKRIGTE